MIRIANAENSCRAKYILSGYARFIQEKYSSLQFINKILLKTVEMLLIV